VGLVQHNEIQIRQIAPVHGIVELVPKYFGRSDNEGGIRVFLSVTRQYPDVPGPEAITKFGILGVAEGLQRACVPGFGALLLLKPIDGGFGNPGFTGTGGGGYKAVRLMDRLKRFDLERIGLEAAFFRNADARKNFFQAAVYFRTDLSRLPPSPARSVTAPGVI
jgi:hypothetical protein